MSDRADPGNTRLHLIGSRSVQTQCLLDVLNEHLPASLHTSLADAVSIVCLREEVDEVNTILLIDVTYLGIDRILEELRSAKLPENTYPALMNVDRDAAWSSQSVVHGIRGLFFDDDPVSVVLKGVVALLDGGVWISRETLLKAIVQPAREHGSNGGAYSNSNELTRREREILGLICVGATNQEIADKLFISTNTVKTHIYKIYKKIDVPNRMQAALWGAKNL